MGNLGVSGLAVPPGDQQAAQDSAADGPKGKEFQAAMKEARQVEDDKKRLGRRPGHDSRLERRARLRAP